MYIHTTDDRQPGQPLSCEDRARHLSFAAEMPDRRASAQVTFNNSKFISPYDSLVQTKGRPSMNPSALERRRSSVM